MHPRLASSALLSLLTLAGTSALADDDESERQGSPLARYEISVTNVTRDQRFTPILGVTHGSALRLFTAGDPASLELAVLAEEGNTAPLGDALRSSAGVREVVASNGLLDAGATAELEILGTPSDRISIAAMLIPTNDAFFAVNGVDLPRGFETLRLSALAYDAGSERNDELCSSIPGPFFVECGGPGGGAAVEGDEEGFVHVHAGIHGIGDLDESQRDWRNPVAMIAIRRVR